MGFLSSIEFKVGAMVLAVAGLIGVMSMQVSDDPGFSGNKRKAWFLLPNASGLIKNGAVKTAGIRVGTVNAIKLQDGQARVEVTIDGDLPLTTSASVEIKSVGILGDKHVEIKPGNQEDPPLPNGGQILIISDKASMDNIIAQVGDIAKSLKDVADVVKQSISDDGTEKHILGRIVKNIDKLTSDIAQITSENKGQISKIVDQVDDITTTLDQMINDESDEGIKKTLKRTLARVDSAMKNLDEITGKVNRGEGTIGKLVNDETTVEELNTAIQGVNNMLGGADKIQTGFDFNGNYLSAVGGTKSNIGLFIQPGLDRYYYLAIVDDPAGKITTTDTLVTSGGSTISDTTTRTTFRNETKLTLLYAKNFWDFTIKGGLIENTGGFGLDYNLFRQKLVVGFEAFNLQKANLRFNAKYNLYHGFYVSAGLNDTLDKNSQRSSYLGAGLFLTNDDLKLFLSKASF
jgi:phospholipid/cholesterol/gamma-HCH transport system substrate-binding protein